jgi:ankyrin repeat protein
MKLLLGRHADVNMASSDGSTPISNACQLGNFEAMKLFIEYGADVNSVPGAGLSLLHTACARLVHPEIIKELREQIEAHPNNAHEALAKVEKSATYEEIVELLLGSGADPNITTNDSSCLFMACDRGSLETVKILVEKGGANVNLASRNGSTPLSQAKCNAKNRPTKTRLDIIRYLKSKGATEDGH